MVRFLHSSDWQLGMTRHFLAGEAQARFTQDRIDGVRRLGELARQHGAAFVVVAGDVFESNQVARATVVRALEALAAIPAPVLLLPGNHDPLDAASVYRSPTFAERRPANVVVLADGRPIEPPGTSGVEVVGAPWDTKRPLADLVGALASALAPCPPGRLRVAVGHGAVDDVAGDFGSPATIRRAAAEAALADGRLHYLALGDRHSTTAVGGTGAIWYSGAHVATDFDEVDPGNALLVELEPGAAPRVTPLPVAGDGGWRFLDWSARLDAEDDVEALAARLAAVDHKERAIVRLALAGSLGLAETARLEAVLADAEGVFASVQRWGRHEDLVVVPDDLDEQQLPLAGYARSAWDELAAQARAGGEGAAEARDALALFFRLARAEAAP
jgi:DNA repair exonuclease SbcCD nuclease subunit